MAPANKPRDLPLFTRLKLAAYGFILDLCIASNAIRHLIRHFEPKSPPSTNPVNGVTSSDCTIDPSRDHLWFRLYNPTSSTTTTTTNKLPLLFYFHGGGFVLSAPNSKQFHNLCLRLAAEIPSVVVSVNYRLTPEHRFPSQYDDAFHAIKFIDSPLSDAVLPPTVDLTRCFVAGDSAGGNIAHHVALRACSSKRERMKIMGLISVQPFFGGEERTESELRLNRAPIVNVGRTDWMWRQFLPIGSDRNHPAAHVMGEGEAAAEEMNKKFPATIVFIGGLDPLQDWQRRYYEWLKNKVGVRVELVEYPSAIHAFYGLPEMPQTDLLVKKVSHFIHNQSSS